MSEALPKDGHTYRIWSVVEELVLGRLEQIQDERMRDSYYLLREWLNQRREAGEITDAEFDYFVENYEYYRDSVWPRLEKEHGIRRPKTKPPTIVYEDGAEFTEAHIDVAWERSRGFIFVEKSGMAEDLALLSEHGWLIVAAQGESTRSFREKVANDDTDRPVLVVTDADYYGGGITQSLKGHSERTAHLNLAAELHDRVQEIGLTQADADALDLPRERDPTQSPDEWRTELNALTVLKDRHGIDVPLLAYVAAKMAEVGIPLCPLPLEDTEGAVAGSLEIGIEEALAEAVDDAVAEVMDGTDPVEDVDQNGDGDLMKLNVYTRHEGADVDVGDLREQLIDVAQAKFDNLVWIRQTEYEDRVKQDVGADDVATIEERL